MPRASGFGKPPGKPGIASYFSSKTAQKNDTYGASGLFSSPVASPRKSVVSVAKLNTVSSEAKGSEGKPRAVDHALDSSATRRQCSA